MPWKLWRSTTGPQGNSIFFSWSWPTTGCLAHFYFLFSLFLLFSLSLSDHSISIRLPRLDRTAFSICTNSPRNNPRGRAGKIFRWVFPVLRAKKHARWKASERLKFLSRRAHGSRDSIRRVNVSWPWYRQRENGLLFGRNATKRSVHSVASRGHFRFNNLLLVFLRPRLFRGHCEVIHILRASIFFPLSFCFFSSFDEFVRFYSYVPVFYAYLAERLDDVNFHWNDS